MICPRPLVRLLSLPRNLRPLLTRRPSNIPTTTTTPASPSTPPTTSPPPPSKPSSPRPSLTARLPLRPRLSQPLPIRRRHNLILHSTPRIELRLQSAQPLRIPLHHNAPPLNRLVRQPRLALQRRARPPPPRRRIPGKDSGRRLPRGEQRLVVLVAPIHVHFGIVGAGQGGVDGAADVRGVVGVVALVVVGVEGRQRGQDGGLVRGGAAVGEDGVGGQFGVFAADVQAGGVDGEAVEVVVVEDVAALRRWGGARGEVVGRVVGEVLDVGTVEFWLAMCGLTTGCLQCTFVRTGQLPSDEVVTSRRAGVR